MTKRKSKKSLAENILAQPHKLGQWLGYEDLTPLHSEWIKIIWESEEGEYLEAMRNSFKTSSIVVVGSIWHWLFHPNDRVLIVRKTYTGAAGTLEEIGKHLKGDKIKSLVMEIHGVTDFTLTKETKETITTSLMTKITKEGNFDAIGIGGSITGNHYDKIHCDDISTERDRYSEAEREKTKRFFRELINVVNAGCAINVTGTPWHKNDVAVELPPPRQYPLGNKDLEDAMGKQYIDHIKKKVSKMPPSLAAANYYLKHIADENSYFTDMKYAPLPKSNAMIMQIDAKYKGKDTMAVTVGCEHDGGYYLKGWIFTQSIERMYDRLVEIHKLHNCGTCHMEENADKGLSATELRKKGMPVSGYHEAQNKHVKILSFLSGNYDKVFFDEGSDREYLMQIVDYAEGQEPDDAPDSASVIIKKLGGSGSFEAEEDYSSNDIDYLYSSFDRD